MGKINVLQLITGLGMGGAEKVVLDLSLYINKRDFNIFVVGMSKRDELLKEFLKNGIQVILLRKKNSLKDFIDIFQYLDNFVKQNNIQIIHAHMTHSVIISGLLKMKNPSLKVIYTSHSSNIGSKIREIILWGLKPFRDIDIIFSKDILKFFYKKDYKVIPNGIKIDKYNLNLEKKNKFTFIAIGRLELVKNHKILIEIANNLKNKYSFEIQIVGDGYLREELKDLIKKYNLEDYVKLLGLRDDIPILLNKAHCLVMPSLWEGFPIVILEAGASNVPIITTPVGSIPSLLNNDNAYLSEVEYFENTMIEVMKNYNKAMQKGKVLFHTMQNMYSIDFIIKEHEKIYKELV